MGKIVKTSFGAVDRQALEKLQDSFDTTGATQGKTFYGFSRDFVCKLFAVNCFELEDPGTVFDLIQVM